MPYCGRSVYYNSLGKRINHFTHYSVENCPEKEIRKYDIVSKIHDKVTQNFDDWILYPKY